MNLCKKCNTEKKLSDFYRKHLCKNCNKIRCKEWRSKNRDKNIEYHRSKYVERSAYIKEWNKQDYQANPQEWSNRSKKYRDNNKPAVYARNAKRRADQVQATPSWANLCYIKLFYQMVKDEQVRTGREIQVDHIVPLNSPYVSGLHCEDNLQLLFKEDNIKKGNRTWPDMWEEIPPQT